jgi:phosphoglucomutase
LKSGKTTLLDFPKSDVIQFYLEDGTKVSVRPSGTEPKIKFYISVNTKLASTGDFEVATKKLDEKISGVEQYLKTI